VFVYRWLLNMCGYTIWLPVHEPEFVCVCVCVCVLVCVCACVFV